MTAVVITGVGLHSCFGDATSTWQALDEMKTGFSFSGLTPPPGWNRLLQARAAPYAADLAGLVRDHKLMKYMSGSTELAVLAAGRALGHAGLLADAEAKQEMALYCACDRIAYELTDATAALCESLDEHGRLDACRMGEGLRHINPLAPFKMLLNMPLGLTSVVYGIRGGNAVTYPGPVAGAACLGAVVRGLCAGRFQRGLVGGTSLGASLVPLAAAAARGILSRPGADGDGLAPADAAAFLVIERATSANSGGRTPLALVTACAARTSACVADEQDTAELEEDAEAHALVEAQVEAASATALAACGDVRPDVVVVTGCTKAAEVAALAQQLVGRWPTLPPIVRPDQAIGFAGSAAPALMVALGTQILAHGRLPAGLANAGPSLDRPVGSVLVVANDPGVGAAATLLTGVSSKVAG